MDSAKPTVAPADDVLHIDAQSKLSPEEIAKALAHHNRHHHGEQPSLRPLRSKNRAVAIAWPPSPLATKR
jgi:hypothetical protein